MKFLSIHFLLLLSFNISLSLSLSTNGFPSQWWPTRIPDPLGIAPVWYTAILGIVLVLLYRLQLHFSTKRRSTAELEECYFRQNGGLLLKQRISSLEGGNCCTRIFSAKELNKATDGYNSSRLLGTGRYNCTVYKGILEDGTVVAVKRPNAMDKTQIDLFHDELLFLTTQINHRNVVKLLGSCLETEFPTLVYEFISNGKLSKHIRGPAGRMAWRDRMRIAIETAEVLVYLHSAATLPNCHGNVKSANILLDDSYTAKVSDFGISRLVPLDLAARALRQMLGTIGYFDPEFARTYELTAKTDVYSFGIVLEELLTGQKPVSGERPREHIHLGAYLSSSFGSMGLGEFVDNDVYREGSADELRGVAELATKCLQVTREERPSMKEVARELVRLHDLQE